jgi:uncharacterized membrane-anchored protein
VSHAQYDSGLVRLFASAWFLAALTTAAPAQEAAKPEPEKPAHVLPEMFKPGPFTADLGGVARLEVPEGCLFVAKKDMAQFNKLTQNLSSPEEVGALVSTGEEKWYIVFSFSNVGYVKDDEKNSIDANAIYKSMKDGEVQENQERKRLGYPGLNMLGWEKAPFYDPNTHNLTWATKLQTEGTPGHGVNYTSRLLGRGGYMSVILVVSPEGLAQAVPAYDKLLKGFTYIDGQKYSEWKEGDKIAAYGLTALVTGGVAVAAVKSGLFGKLLGVLAVAWKGIILAIGAIGAAVSTFFRKIFGKSRD